MKNEIIRSFRLSEKSSEKPEEYRRWLPQLRIVLCILFKGNLRF